MKTKKKKKKSDVKQSSDLKLCIVFFNSVKTENYAFEAYAHI